MQPTRFYFFYSLFLYLLFQPSYASDTAPRLLLANVYHKNINLDDYWVSEKLDGVRAYWDGQHLLSRQGKPFNAPAWFTQAFPSIHLDGELWMGLDTFEALSGTVRRKTPDEQAWRNIRFMVFDLPAANGDFNRRLRQLRVLIPNIKSQYIALVKQYKVPNQGALFKRLEQTVRQGGEGLMLHKGSSHYTAARSDDLLKLKTYQDAEAKVIAHMPGKGKYTDMMGSLLVQMPNGLQFKLGTGFTDAERKAPPAVGSVVSYRHIGKTKRGVPRFASFIRVRDIF